MKLNFKIPKIMPYKAIVKKLYRKQIHKLYKRKHALSRMKIVFTPDWFLGTDVLIEFFSFLVLFMFFLFSMKSYKTNKNRNSFYLGVGFLLIALAELATIITKFVLYYDLDFTNQIGNAIINYNVANSVDIFYYIGFFFHKLLTLGGLYAIYRIPLKNPYKGDIILAIVFMIIASLFSNTIYYIFHLTALLLLILIIMNYTKVYQINKSRNTKVLIISFILLALSQVIFLVSKLQILYAIAQIMQLVSYLTLLVLIIRIMKHGKKKK